MPNLPIPLTTLFQLLTAASGGAVATSAANPQVQDMLGLLVGGATNLISQLHALGPQIAAGHQTADPLRSFFASELRQLADRIEQGGAPQPQPTA